MKSEYLPTKFTLRWEEEKEGEGGERRMLVNQSEEATCWQREVVNIENRLVRLEFENRT